MITLPILCLLEHCIQQRLSPRSLGVCSSLLDTQVPVEDAAVVEPSMETAASQSDKHISLSDYRMHDVVEVLLLFLTVIFRRLFRI